MARMVDRSFVPAASARYEASLDEASDAAGGASFRIHKGHAGVLAGRYESP